MKNTFTQAIREKIDGRKTLLIDGIEVTQKAVNALQDYVDWVFLNEDKIGMSYQPAMDEIRARLKGQVIELDARLQIYAYNGLEIGNEGGYTDALVNIRYDMDRTLHGDNDRVQDFSAIERAMMEVQVDECTEALELIEDTLSGAEAEPEAESAEAGTAATV